ncbi:hypothetical protein CH63R_12106 [Colletotrichum higginsianum IMI 349063]|uniref:Uncharacterized protein n=3 Tax=Colletotrichum higginsianum TaxID=80884 RepID=A0A1B7Y062_COLHI|nr:hypothetical protein CH63R_12106 [Colletotrichum higginsianum IMI 349063]OBR05403.1 hypothetical protein CH63R_12106 [Colletotrichum higginsianum IMI 349063]
MYKKPIMSPTSRYRVPAICTSLCLYPSVSPELPDKRSTVNSFIFSAMRFSILPLITAFYVSSVTAETFLQIGQACAAIGDSRWQSNCNAADTDSCRFMCSDRCQTDQGRWMATPKGDCDCYCN